MADVFKENKVPLIQGDVEISTELLKLFFNHIFFPGSPEVGRIIMITTTKNLVSVTLELDGKSPIVSDKSADINKVAKK